MFDYCESWLMFYDHICCIFFKTYLATTEITEPNIITETKRQNIREKVLLSIYFLYISYKIYLITQFITYHMMFHKSRFKRGYREKPMFQAA